MEINHYTLNTADSSTHDRPVDETLKSLCLRAIEEGQTESKIPGFEAWTVKITVDQGCSFFGVYDCALFDVYDPDRRILTTNAVAWTQPGSEMIWEIFEPFYLKLARDMGVVQVLRLAQQPNKLPWLGSFVLPNPSIAEAGPWLAVFEQAIAVTLIALATDQPKAKGFGWVIGRS